jgi:pyridoxine 5-phosphate synthase
MTSLSVNLNKVALIRNSRGKNLPDLLQVAADCVRMGADGITVHPRPDERHVRRSDVYALKEMLNVELNVEGYPSEDFLRMIEEARPAQATLVPDPPEALTSSAGWEVRRHQQALFEIVRRIQGAGVRASIFVAPDLEAIEAARELYADRIELYTEAYSEQYDHASPEEAVEPYRRAAQFAQALGLGVNAGHDLNLRNLAYLKQQIPFLDEVSIGHALVCDALYLGLEETLRRYQACLGKAQ